MYDASGHTRKRRGTVVVGVMAAIIVVLSGVCIYLYLHSRTINQQKTPAEQTASLTAELGKIISLPVEQPSVATVLDRSKLGDQQLASEARNGDTLIVYAKARRVVLYRPSTHKVIDMFHIEAAKASNAEAVQKKTTP